jgi:hypothetical protein
MPEKVSLGLNLGEAHNFKLRTPMVSDQLVMTQMPVNAGPSESRVSVRHSLRSAKYVTSHSLNRQLEHQIYWSIGH